MLEQKQNRESQESKEKETKPKGVIDKVNNTENITLDIPESVEYGNNEDKWLKNAEILLGSLLDKDEVANESNFISKESLED